jgi:transcription elongation factor Elf1
MSTTRQSKLWPSRSSRGPSHVEWLKSDFYCPNCGKQDMWQATNEGDDYYHQYSVVCHACQHEMCCVDKVEP